MSRLNGLYKGVFAAESWTLSQAYFFGSVGHNPAHQVEFIDGMTIDRLDELDEIAIGKPATGATNGNGIGANGPLDETALEEAIVSGAAYHNSCMRLVGKWATQGAPLLEVHERLCALFDRVDETKRDARWTERRADIPNILAYIYPKEGAKRDQSICDGQFRKPIVRVSGGDLPEVVEDAERHLIRYDHGLFQKGDFLVRAAPSTINIADNRKTTGTRLIRIGKHHLVERLTQFVDFQRYNIKQKAWVSIDAPDKVAMTYLARVGAWGVQVLTGVTDCPTLRPDGSIIDQPGYDLATGILYQPRGIGYPPIPQKPTKDEAIRALEVLKAPLSEFLFTDNPSRSVPLSGNLTATIRRSLPTAPLHSYTAPVAGSGKSMLVDIASIIASGHEAPVITPGETKEESEKRLGSQLLAGDAVISFDNCDGPLSSALLCQTLTQANVKIRILGKSETPTVPNNALIFANGNNLVLVGDLTRRSIRGSLDPKCERPELRPFKTGDLVGAVKRNRAQLLVACLTILRAFDEAGRPDQGGVPLGSFETWWHWVRGALVWLGEADPCETMDKVREDDPKRQAVDNVLRHWKAAFGPEELTAKQLVDRATEYVPPPQRQGVDFNPPTRREFMYPDLRDALLAVASDRGMVDAQRLGFWLRSIKGRIINNMRIVQGFRERSWKIEEVRP
jgi:hypothetical protein